MEKEKVSNRKATFIASVLCLVVLTIFTLYQIFSGGEKYPSCVRIAEKIGETNEYTVYRMKEYRLVTVSVDTIKKKERVKSTLEYER